jgi:hypothetical protein
VKEIVAKVLTVPYRNAVCMAAFPFLKILDMQQAHLLVDHDPFFWGVSMSKSSS